MIENYNLSWNGFSSTIMSFWAENLNKDVFCDTTIVCKGKQYAVHKLILSLGSKFFQNILEKTPCSQPLIIIDDIEISDLEGILQFLYTGEAVIKKNMLPQFLKAAKSLQIKGLDTTPNSNHMKNYISRNITSQLIEKNDNCDFYGFPKRNYCDGGSSPLSTLKQKLVDLKDIDLKKNYFLNHPNNKTLEINNDMDDLEVLNGNIGKISNKNILLGKQTDHYIVSHASKEIKYPLQVELNFRERCNIKSTTSEKENLFLTLPKNSNHSKINPFVPIKRLKDSVLKAAFNGQYPNIMIQNVYSLKDMKIAYESNSLDHSSSQVKNFKESHKNVEVPVFDMDGIVQSGIDIRSIGQDVNKCEMEESADEANVRFSLRQMKQCAYCPFRNKSLSTMKKHLKNHGPGPISSKDSHCLPGNLKLFKCSICSFTAQSKRTVNKHMFDIHPKQNRHKSLHGNKNVLNSSVKPSKLFIHKNIHGVQKLSSHKLKHCSFRTKANMESNIFKFCHAPKLFKCKYCSFTSSRSLVVSKHENVHSEYFNPSIGNDQSTTFKCKYCKYSTTSESALQGHESYHNKDEEPFKCRFCSYKSAIQTIVKCHELTHNI